MENSEPYILGIDLGTNSLGWALIRLNEAAPQRLIRCGARVFDAGMDGDIASGSEESRNLKRRQMRSQRRQIERRARRQRKVYHVLHLISSTSSPTSAASTTPSPISPSANSTRTGT